MINLRDWMANLMAEVRIEEKSSSENLSSETSGHLGNSGDLTPGKPGQPGEPCQLLQPGQLGQLRLAVQGPSPDGSLLSLPGDPTESKSQVGGQGAGQVAGQGAGDQELHQASNSRDGGLDKSWTRREGTKMRSKSLKCNKVSLSVISPNLAHILAHSSTSQTPYNTLKSAKLTKSECCNQPRSQARLSRRGGEGFAVTRPRPT